MSDSRAEFEKFADSLELDITRVNAGDCEVYSDCNTDYAWMAWQASRAQPERKPMSECCDTPNYCSASRRCTAQDSAKPERKLTDELPPLPHTTYNGYSDGSEPLYTADQMRDYARALLAAQPAAATALDKTPTTLLTEQQWIDLNNVAFMLEHMHAHAMADQVRAICDASEISQPSAQPPAAQPQDDGENMHTQSTHQENVSKNAPEMNTLPKSIQPSWGAGSEVFGSMRKKMLLCPVCGNKRCPHANDPANACTGSNEPGQIGSRYP